MGGVELEAVSEPEGGGRPRYMETGRCFLVEIPNRSADTFRAQIEQRVGPGSTVWTDSHASYQWLDGAGYRHERVNHRQSEWVGGRGQSTNACEGMWSRVKRGLRMTCVRKPVDNDYAPLMAEFVWRSRYSRGDKWRQITFTAVLDLIVVHYGAARQQREWAKEGFVCDGQPSLFTPPQK